MAAKRGRRPLGYGPAPSRYALSVGGQIPATLSPGSKGVPETFTLTVSLASVPPGTTLGAGDVVGFVVDNHVPYLSLVTAGPYSVSGTQPLTLGFSTACEDGADAAYSGPLVLRPNANSGAAVTSFGVSITCKSSTKRGVLELKDHTGTTRTKLTIATNATGTTPNVRNAPLTVALRSGQNGPQDFRVEASNYKRLLVNQAATAFSSTSPLRRDGSDSDNDEQDVVLATACDENDPADTSFVNAVSLFATPEETFQDGLIVEVICNCTTSPCPGCQCQTKIAHFWTYPALVDGSSRRAP